MCAPAIPAAISRLWTSRRQALHPDFVRWILASCVLAACAIALTSMPREASAQDLRSRLVVAIDRLEHEISDHRWNLNTLEEKRALERDLDLLKKLYDRVLQHENDIMTLECAGATIDPSGGPPRSSADSDELGALTLNGPASSNGGGGSAPPVIQGPDGITATGPLGGYGRGFGFARQITDTEIRLLAELVRIDDRVEHEQWHLNNLEEKKALLARRASVLSALRRVRNSRC